MNDVFIDKQKKKELSAEWKYLKGNHPLIFGVILKNLLNTFLSYFQSYFTLFKKVSRIVV